MGEVMKSAVLPKLQDSCFVHKWKIVLCKTHIWFQCINTTISVLTHKAAIFAFDRTEKNEASLSSELTTYAIKDK